MSLGRVILHIGSPKTGTSILQSHLQQNRRVLADKGVFYPVTMSPYPHVYRTFESHHLLTYAVAGWKPFDLFSPERFLDRARETCAEHGMHTMLLSAENTYWLPRLTVTESDFDPQAYWSDKIEFVRSLRRCLQAFDVTVVVYFRRQDHWIESWYNQQIKNGNAVGDDFEAFGELHDVYLDYLRNVDLWAGEFGEQNIVVRAYEKAQLPDGLLTQFLDLFDLGQADEYPLHKPGRHNSKLDRDTMEFMKILNRIDMGPEDRTWLRLAVRKVSNQFERQEIFKSLGLCPPDVRHRIVAKYEAGNAAIAQRYLAGAQPNLFVEAAPTTNDAWETYPGLPVDYSVSMMVKLLLEARGLQAEASTSPPTSGGQPDEMAPAALAKAEDELWHELLFGEQTN